jgi:phosphoribosyl-AMP cyclohydrolase
MHEIMRRMLLHLCVGIMNFLNQITQDCDLESLKASIKKYFSEIMHKRDTQCPHLKQLK